MKLFAILVRSCHPTPAVLNPLDPEGEPFLLNSFFLPVTRTLEGLREGRDEFLEKAIETVR